MAIIDWPTSRALAPASFELGIDVSEYGFQGFYSGNRTRFSNLADRLTLQLTLPPCLPVDAALREAFLMGLRSRGDQVRLSIPGRRVPRGSFGGSPVLAAAATAGTRSLSISTALARPNLLFGHAFGVDANSNDVGDLWVLGSAGTTGTVTPGRPVIEGEITQQISCTNLGTLTTDSAYLQYAGAAIPVVAGQNYCLAVDCSTAGPAGNQVRLQVDWGTSLGAYISTSTFSINPTPGVWARPALVAAAPATAALAVPTIVMTARNTAAGAASTIFRRVQFEQGLAASAYSGLPSLQPGDMLELAGNLVQVAYAGATGTDQGAITVPLVTPLMVGVASGTAVTWSSPRGLWELDVDAMQLAYGPSVTGPMQQGLVVALRQVPA